MTESRSVPSVVRFANIDFKGVNNHLLLKEPDHTKVICTVNAQYIVMANRDPVLRTFLCQQYSTFDGQVPYAVAKLLCRGRVFEKISGADFVYEIFRYAQRHDKGVFVLGGYPASNSGAVERVRREFGVRIAGFAPPASPLPFPRSMNTEIMRRISADHPDFLLIAFGAGKQEYWAMQHLKQLDLLGVKWVMGIGGTLDFVSGRIPRAPRCVQLMGMEGFFRFVMQPSVSRLKRLLVSVAFLRYAFFPRELGTSAQLPDALS